MVYFFMGKNIEMKKKWQFLVQQFNIRMLRKLLEFESSMSVLLDAKSLKF